MSSGGSSPKVISKNEDGRVRVEECFNRKQFNARWYAVGHFLKEGLVFCGGISINYEGYGENNDDCIVIKRLAIESFKMIENERTKASSVKLNETTMWITGGNGLYSTEFATISGSTKGIDLPFTISRHCMVKLESNVIFLIGGTQNDSSYSDKTWIIDMDNDFNLREGPLLNEGRKYPLCSQLKDDFGHDIIVVVAGNSGDTIEFLNVTLMDKWMYGRYSVTKHQQKNF